MNNRQGIRHVKKTVRYAKGLQFLAATYEQKGVEALMLDDRLMQVTVSLIRL